MVAARPSRGPSPWWAWPWIELPGLRLTKPAEALLTRSMHRGRKSSTQLRAMTKSGQHWSARGAKRAVPLVGESVESRFAHADDSAPPKRNRVQESAPASATASVPVRVSTRPQKLKDGTCCIDYNGYMIC